MFEFWGVDFRHFLRHFQASFEIFFCADLFRFTGSSGSAPNYALNDQDQEANENNNDDEPNTGKNGNLYF